MSNLAIGAIQLGGGRDIGAIETAEAPPIFSGTIPDITGTEGDADIVTDLTTYFTLADSYSIAPAVESGWTFTAGILTVTTSTPGTFGTYVVTATNTDGTADSNAFSVIISVAETERTAGGFWLDYELEYARRAKAKAKREEEEEKAKRIKDKLLREIALEERKLEAKEARDIELSMITKLAIEHKAQLEQELAENVIQAANRAIMQHNYSAMEALERLLNREREEEIFLMQAARILLNA